MVEPRPTIWRNCDTLACLTDVIERLLYSMMPQRTLRRGKTTGIRNQDLNAEIICCIEFIVQFFSVRNNSIVILFNDRIIVINLLPIKIWYRTWCWYDTLSSILIFRAIEPLWFSISFEQVQYVQWSYFSSSIRIFNTFFLKCKNTEIFKFSTSGTISAWAEIRTYQTFKNDLRSTTDLFNWWVDFSETACNAAMFPSGVKWFWKWPFSTAF